MAENKTQPHAGSVPGFLDSIDDELRREDARAVCKLMMRITGEHPTMWGPSIVGFGQLHLRYDSGRELDWFLVGFSPRKQSTTLYIGDGFEAHAGLLSRLGRHSTGKSCLHIKRLSDVDTDVLEQLVTDSVEHQRGSPETTDPSPSSAQ